MLENRGREKRRRRSLARLCPFLVHIGRIGGIMTGREARCIQSPHTPADTRLRHHHNATHPEACKQVVKSSTASRTKVERRETLVSLQAVHTHSVGSRYPSSRTNVESQPQSPLPPLQHFHPYVPAPPQKPESSPGPPYIPQQ